MSIGKMQFRGNLVAWLMSGILRLIGCYGTFSSGIFRCFSTVLVEIKKYGAMM